MSYASVAAHNAPSPSEQPKPDTSLLNTSPPKSPPANVSDDSIKVSVVRSDFKENPATVTSERRAAVESKHSGASREHEGREDESGEESTSEHERDEEHRERRRERIKRCVKDSEKEAEGIWEVATERVLRPGVAGGLLGVVNIGLLSWASYSLYTKPELRGDMRTLAAGGTAFLVLFTLEGAAAEAYAKSAMGKEEKRRAKEKGSQLYQHARNVITQPASVGGLIGIANVGLLGTVGRAMYRNWDNPDWDHRVVGAITVGMLGLWTGESYLLHKYWWHRS